MASHIFAGAKYCHVKVEGSMTSNINMNVDAVYVNSIEILHLFRKFLNIRIQVHLRV